MPSTVETAVMSTGRNRSRAASAAASASRRPRATSTFVQSTSKMAFFVTIPTSMTSPMKA